MAYSGVCCGGVIIVFALLVALTTLTTTNTYAEEGDSGLAKAAGRHLSAGIWLVFLCICGFGGLQNMLVLCAVLGGVISSILFMIAGILVAVSTARSSEGRSWGAVAATFNFLSMFVPWCIFCGIAICGSSSGKGGGRGSYRSSPRVYRSSSPREPRLVPPELTDEQKRQFAAALSAMTEEEMQQLGTALSALTEKEKQQLATALHNATQ